MSPDANFRVEDDVAGIAVARPSWQGDSPFKGGGEGGRGSAMGSGDAQHGA